MWVPRISALPLPRHKESYAPTPQHGADTLSTTPLSPAWDPSSRTPYAPMEVSDRYILPSFRFQLPQLSPEPKPGE
jgi:hypothetical protein